VPLLSAQRLRLKNKKHQTIVGRMAYSIEDVMVLMNNSSILPPRVAVHVLSQDVLTFRLSRL